MTAILKREINAYFNAPTGYVFLAVYYVLSGYFFYAYNIYANTTNMTMLFEVLFVITIFLVPLLTMRLMSEDRKSKTDQLLSMTPISATEIVFGKYLAGFVLFLLSTSVLLIYALLLEIYSTVDWAVVFGHYFGLLLLGGALISIGVFISSLTENQIIAAIGGFLVGFLLVMLNIITPKISSPILASLVGSISFMTRYRSFTFGILNIADTMFFLSVILLFIYFTILTLEKRRVA